MKLSIKLPIKYIIIAFIWLISLVIVANKCSRVVRNDTEIIKYDTIWNDTTIYSVKYIPKHYTKHDTIYKENTIFLTDTVEIVKVFNQKLKYADTLFKENQFKLIINDIVYQNKIISRDWKYTNLSPIGITSTKIIKNSRHFYVQGQISTYKSFSPSFGVMYLDKKRNALTLMYDPLNKTYSFGYGYKIF